MATLATDGEASRPRRRRSSLGRRLSVRLVAAVIACLFAVLIGEAVVRIIAPQNLSGRWRTTDRHGLFLNTPNHSARHQFQDRVVRYEFDARGLRDLGLGDAPTQVLCLGDSFTFGWLLNDRDTFIARLQQAADAEFGSGRVILLDGGHGGWGTSDYVRYFEEYGRDLDVDGVIVFFNIDDIGRSLLNPRYSIAADGQVTALKSEKIPRDSATKRVMNSLPFYDWLLEHSHLFQIARRVVLMPRGSARGAAALTSATESSPAGKSVNAVQAGQALVRHLKQLADGLSTPLMVLTTGFHGKPTAADTEPTQLFMATAAPFFAEEAIEFHDCSEDVLTAAGGDYQSLQIPGEGHPDEAGAKVIAEKNWPFVRAFLERLVAAPAAGSTDKQ